MLFFFEQMESHKTLFGWDWRMSSVRPLKTASKEDNGKTTSESFKWSSFNYPFISFWRSQEMGLEGFLEIPLGRTYKEGKAQFVRE